MLGLSHPAAAVRQVATTAKEIFMSSTLDPDGALFAQLRPRLIAISLRIVGSQAEAEDVVQDCFLKWHAAARETLATPAAWLTTVVQHQSIDRLRKRVRDAAAACTALELSPEAEPPVPEDALLRRAELGDALGCLLARLSPAERLALVLHDVFECDHATIAAALGTRPANVRQYLSRARRRLREDKAGMSPDEKLCRELIRRFQAALNGIDVPAMMTLLTETQPMSVVEARPVRMRARAGANDACYALAA
jgi:RNA polymerase sigma-70 factor (ECF subfamily)